jgi:hypothetical protein
MNRLLYGLAVLGVSLVGVGCGDPTASLRSGPAKIVADPTSLFLANGQTATVIVRVLDDQGNELQDTVTASTTAGSTVTVKVDSTFLVGTDTTNPGAPVPLKTRSKFLVTGGGVSSDTVVFSAGGLTLQVPVRVTPGTVSLSFSNAAPQWGDTITITAPSGVLFTDSSLVAEGGLACNPAAEVPATFGCATIIGLSTDKTVLTVVPGPNARGPVTVRHATVSYNQALDFEIVSTDSLNTPRLDTLFATASTTTPGLGQPVTITLPAGVRVIPESIVTPLADTTAAGLVVQGNLLNLASADVTVSADSGKITFIPPPSSDSTILIPGIIPAPLPQYPQTMATTFKVTTPLIDSLGVAFSSTSPAVLEEITLTAPAGFTFNPDATVEFGGLPAIINSVTNTSIKLVPIPGSTGVGTIVGVTATLAPQFTLKLPTKTGITVPPLTPLAGTDDPSTAPTVTTPGTLNDAGSFAYACEAAGGFPCQVYKLSFASTTTLNYTLTGFGSPADLGLYFTTTADLTTAVKACDSLGRDDVPESCPITLPAGDYIMEVVTFGPGYPEDDPNPPVIQVKIQ